MHPHIFHFFYSTTLFNSQKPLPYVSGKHTSVFLEVFLSTVFNQTYYFTNIINRTQTDPAHEPNLHTGKGERLREPLFCTSFVPLVLRCSCLPAGTFSQRPNG